MSDDYYVPTSQKGLFGNIALWAIGLVLLIGAISIALWAFGVFTSDLKGRGDAVKIKNSAVNRIQQQEQFVQLNEDYQGTLAKIEISRQSLANAGATPEEKQIAQTNLDGVKQICVDTAQQYNAQSQKYTARDFKSAGLPARLDAQECLS